MKFLTKTFSRIKFTFFGKKAHTRSSKGFIYKGEYFVTKGMVLPGEIIMLD